MINKIKNIDIKELAGYCIIALVNYPLLFALLFFFNTKLVFSDQASFFWSYLLAYCTAYFLQAKFLFKTGHTNSILGKYVLQILIFFSLGNLSFYVLNYIFDLDYIFATIITIIILFPIRYFFSKLYVFK